MWANSHLGAGRCSLWLSRGLHSVYSVHSFGGKGGVQDAMLMGSGGGTDCGSQIQSQAWAKLRAGARASPAPSLVPVCRLAERPQVPTRQGTRRGRSEINPGLDVTNQQSQHISLLFEAQLTVSPCSKGYGIVCMPWYFEVRSLPVLGDGPMLAMNSMDKERRDI